MKQTNKRERRREEMFSKIEACLHSGQSKSSWCEQEGISPAVYYYWQGEYYRSISDQQGSFIELVPDHLQSSSPAMELTYPNGVRLSFNLALSAERLRELIHAY